MYITKWLRNLGFFILLILPFQGLPGTLLGLKKSGGAEVFPVWVKALSYIDEVSFFIFLGIGATFFCLKPAVYRLPKLPLTKWLVAFIAFGFFLAVVKAVPIFQAGFGIYDLVKSIVVLYVFSMMHYDEKEFIRIVKSVINIGLVLAIVAILGEFMAITFNFGINYLVSEDSRFGIYRIYSLTGSGNHNYIGLYGILCFFLSYALAIKGNRKFFRMGSLLMMIFLTMSRQAWLGFIMIFILMKRWLKLFLPLLPFFVLAIIYFLGTETELDPDAYPRLYAYLESAKILAIHPLTGLGPGMFGDLASILWESPVYDTWPLFFRERVYTIRSIDTFWPVVWGGYGLIGMVLYCSAWLSIFNYLGKAAAQFKDNGSDKLCNLGMTLKYFLIALAIMGFAGGINSPFVTYTYFAMIGIYLSLNEQAKKYDDEVKEYA